MNENKTVNIAVIEDEKAELELLCNALDEFGKRRGITFCRHIFGYATEFLENWSPNYDIVFMDIQLPDLDGISAAKKLREKDKSVVLVFVTNFAQFAVNGYEVNAADFIVKPVQYTHFAAKMERILTRISSVSDVTLAVKTPNGIVSVAASQLKYVEVFGHGLIFHTTFGVVNAAGTLYKVEERLKDAHFVRCNNCYLVNPRYVESVGTYTTVVGGDELKVSYAKRKDYRTAIAKYLGGIV